MKKAIILLIKLYQRGISPLFKGACRFYPTCSAYTIQAVQKYGAIKGVWLGTKRVLKCHPWHPGGEDPVP